MKYHLIKSNLREESEEPQLAVASKKDVRHRVGTHVAKTLQRKQAKLSLLAKLGCPLVAKICISYTLIKPLAIIKGFTRSKFDI